MRLIHGEAERGPIISLGVVAGAVMKHRVHPSPAQQSLGGEALLDAHRAPWEAARRRLDRPD